VSTEFTTYVAKQQQVLNFLLSSLSKEMLEYVAVYATPEEVWENLVTMASSQSRAHVINTLHDTLHDKEEHPHHCPVCGQDEGTRG
jgi:hypothetical protein